MFCGYQYNELYRQADLVLNLGMDVPWCPLDDAPDKHASVIHIGEDPLFQKIPIRTHRGDVFLVANIMETLQLLGKRLDDELSDEAIGARRSEIKNRQLPMTPDLSTLNPEHVAFAINQIWDRDCILVNELSLPPDLIAFDQPGCYFRTGSASGLGWGLAAAAGIALARPEKTVIAVVGDGSYYFANPMAVHWLANKHNLKLLTVVLNNGGMKSFQTLTHKHFPDGAAVTGSHYPLTSLEPAPDFELITPIFNGTGHVVNQAGDLKSALSNALSDVRTRGQQSLVNVRL
jgi:acetolactate synthase-1/2/3 large subunit